AEICTHHGGFLRAIGPNLPLVSRNLFAVDGVLQNYRFKKRLARWLARLGHCRREMVQRLCQIRFLAGTPLDEAK
ncbi:MAG TPA: hypothetical protein VK769_06085, partial [Verrucomicrobiae bacterium]|nr:hypothetical protein [Verrucomicrobiae bacterium]